jgi:hypothetical protein
LGASAASDTAETNASLVWLQVGRRSPLRKEELPKLVPLTRAAIDEAVDRLVADGRIRLENRSDGIYCVAEQCLISIGHAAGWEASVIDHHRAVLTALAAKIQAGTHVSNKRDEIGGTTLSFDLWPGHPLETEVRRLLADVRDRIIPLWEKVEAHNRANPAEPSCRVTFYCGQHLAQADSEGQGQ